MALRQRAEANGVSGAGERDPVFGKFHEIPGDTFGNLIFGLAFGVDIDFYGSSGMNWIALDAADIEAIGFEVPERFLAESIIADTAGDDAGVTEESSDVGEIGGSAAQLFAFGEKIPKEFAEAYDDGAGSFSGSGHGLRQVAAERKRKMVRAEKQRRRGKPGNVRATE